MAADSLDLAALRKAAKEAMEEGYQLRYIDATPPPVILSLLDRIEELEKENAAFRETFSMGVGAESDV